MLKISDTQQLALSSNGRDRYLRGLEARLAERNPALAATFDEARMHAVVEAAVAAAEACGFTNRGPIRLYLDVCVAFGSGFLNDPMLPWASKALGAPDPATQAARADALFASSSDAVDAVHGPDDAFIRAALAALLAWAQQDKKFPPRESLGPHVVNQMAGLYPQKAAHGGEAAMRALVTRADRACAAHGVDAPRAVMLVTALQFYFGAGCLTDPIYGWIGVTLADQRVPDPAERFARLERKAITWLQAVVARQAQEA